MTGRGLLLNELEWITGNCCRLFDLLKQDDYGYAPLEGMRTLVELTNHIAQVPQVDLRIIQGQGETEIKELEKSLWCEQPKDWAGVMREGTTDLQRFMDQLSLDDYENDSGTAYFGRTQTHARWLLEVITHCYHHRSQLFMYLKLKGDDICTRDLYS